MSSRADGFTRIRMVKMDTVVDRLSSGLFAAGFNFTVNRFTGPGRVGIQSMYVNNATSDR
jgi:uncharacterized protein (AIM24 family)